MLNSFKVLFNKIEILWLTWPYANLLSSFQIVKFNSRILYQKNMSISKFYSQEVVNLNLRPSYFPWKIMQNIFENVMEEVEMIN